MRKALVALGAAALAVGAWACTDLREPSSIVDVEPLQSHVGGTPCDLSSVIAAARGYLGSPYQQQAVERLREMEIGGCGPADEQLGWEVLNIVEKVANDGVGGDVVDGAALVNGVTHCCLGDLNDFEISPEVLAVQGLFGVRGQHTTLPYPPAGDVDSAPVVSREPAMLWFTSPGAAPVARPAIIVLRPRLGSWATVAFGNANFVLGLTGFPIDPLTIGAQTAFQAYELDEIPDLGLGSQVDVIACFTDGTGAPPDPHPIGEEGFEPRVRRASGTTGGILLQEVSSASIGSVCGSVTAAQTAPSRPSALETLARFASNIFLPEPLAAFAVAFTDRTSIGFGGGASFFSKFKLSNADADGVLEFLSVPLPVTRKNAPFDIRVSAKDGDGNPIEVTTLLTIQNNNGVPGFLQGTFTNCEGQETTSPPATPAFGCTREVADPGAGGVAEYLDISISSNGAYIMCVEAFSDGFNFPKTCTSKFNVRN